MTVYLRVCGCVCLNDCWLEICSGCILPFPHDGWGRTEQKDKTWMVRVLVSAIMVLLLIGIGLIPNLAVSHTTRFKSWNRNVSAALSGIIQISKWDVFSSTVRQTSWCFECGHCTLLEENQPGTSVKWLVLWRLLPTSGKSWATLCYVYQFEIDKTSFH